VTDFAINATTAHERSADDSIVLSVRPSGAGGGGFARADGGDRFVV
jgi:hypothetical protein